MSCSCIPNISDMIMHNEAILHYIDRKTQAVEKLCNYRNPSTCPLKENAKKGRSCIKHLSRCKINRWFTTGAVKRNSKV